MKPPLLKSSPEQGGTLRIVVRLLFFGGLAFIAGLSLQLRQAAAQAGLQGRKLALLSEENDRMRAELLRRDREQAEAQSRTRRVEIERAVEEIRGLKFLHPVEYAVVTRREIRAVVAGKLAEMYSEEDFTHISAALARLGLLPPGYPLRQKYIELLGEQIAAFYDQHTHKLFMFEDATLENTQNRVVLAHELTHALQDQHFGLLKLPLELRDNDDVALAASALVEGEATVVMTAYMMRGFSLRTLKESASSALTQNTQQLAQAPRYLRELLLFPYLRGQEFCSVLSAGGGYEALSACYARLPGSTAEILHPERYLARWQPVAVGWPETAFEKTPATVSNVVGEAGLRLQLAPGLDEGAAARLAAAWKGDRFLHFGPLDALVWRTVWSTPEAAAEFQQTQQRGLEARYGGEKPARAFLFASPRAGHRGARRFALRRALAAAARAVRPVARSGLVESSRREAVPPFIVPVPFMATSNLLLFRLAEYLRARKETIVTDSTSALREPAADPP